MSRAHVSERDLRLFLVLDAVLTERSVTRAASRLGVTQSAVSHSLRELRIQPKSAEHLERHPFGKVPVLDYDGLRLLETSAIARFLNDVLPGPSLVPASPEDRARMDMVIGLSDSYGYGALVGGVAAYHLFPEFVGGKNEAARRQGIEAGRKVIELAMRTKRDQPFIAGELSLAELYLAPLLAYVAMTPDADAVFGTDGFSEWWGRVQALPSFKATQ